MNMQREFIKQSIAYYLKNPGPEGMTEAEARRHANADLQFWRDIFKQQERKQ